MMSDGIFNYEEVASTSGEVNLFDNKALLVIPVNKSNHWSLVLVHVTKSNATAQKMYSTVHVYHLDSLSLHKADKSIVRAILKYLRCELQRLNNADGKERVMLKMKNENSIINDEVKVPVQANGYDCGMCVCANFKKTLDLFSDEAVSGDKENSRYSGP